jgi:hypothetical protein
LRSKPASNRRRNVKAEPDAERQFLSQGKAFAYLGGRVVVEDCVQAGWFKPCASKVGKDGRPSLILYAARDLALACARIDAGEYPGAVSL